jgi:hypothetical protein
MSVYVSVYVFFMSQKIHRNLEEHIYANIRMEGYVGLRYPEANVFGCVVFSLLQHLITTCLGSTPYKNKRAAAGLFVIG